MPEVSQNPLVSIITVNYNGRAYLELLYNSLAKISYSPVELILVDNASVDDSVEFVRKNYPGVKILQNTENYMFARGNNEGIKIARGEIICLLNNDVVVDADFLEPVIQAFQNRPDMVAGQPKVLDLNDSQKFEYAGAAGGFIDRYGYPFMRGRLFFELEEDRGQYDTDIEIFWSTGACFFVRKNILDKIGILDENFTMHMEEIDLCWRIHLSGKKIYCIPESKVWHKGGGTLSMDNPQKAYWNFRNNIFLLAKNLSMVNLTRIILPRLCMDFSALLFELIKGKFKKSWSILRAYSWLISHVPLVFKSRKKVQQMRNVKDRDIFRLVYPGSITWEYFIRGRKNVLQLKRINHLFSVKT